MERLCAAFMDDEQHRPVRNSPAAQDLCGLVTKLLQEGEAKANDPGGWGAPREEVDSELPPVRTTDHFQHTIARMLKTAPPAHLWQEPAEILAICTAELTRKPVVRNVDSTDNTSAKSGGLASSQSEAKGHSDAAKPSSSAKANEDAPEQNEENLTAPRLARDSQEANKPIAKPVGDLSTLTKLPPAVQAAVDAAKQMQLSKPIPNKQGNGARQAVRRRACHQ
eukprot:SAG31_NODE_7937_length_1560_cov_1.735797_1_plen_222_part_10